MKPAKKARPAPAQVVALPRTSRVIDAHAYVDAAAARGDQGLLVVAVDASGRLDFRTFGGAPGEDGLRTSTLAMIALHLARMATE